MTVSVIGGSRQQEAREGRGKTPSVRLLDLLAGWSAFVSEEEENGSVDPALSAEEIGARLLSRLRCRPPNRGWPWGAWRVYFTLTEQVRATAGRARGHEPATQPGQ